MFATGPVFPINVDAQGCKRQVMTFSGKCCRNAPCDAAREGDLIGATGEITRAAGSLIFAACSLAASGSCLRFRDDQAGEKADAFVIRTGIRSSELSGAHPRS
jgi:hypothetical protein